MLSFAVPPLENFVMNRVLGDYFETLLYKIFVSIDEHTNIAEVSSGFLVFLFYFEKFEPVPMITLCLAIISIAVVPLCVG